MANYDELGGFTAGMASSMKQLPTLMMQSKYLQEARRENNRRLIVEQMNAIRENLKFDAETMAPLSGEARKKYYIDRIIPQVERLAKAQHELGQIDLPPEKQVNYDSSYMKTLRDDVDKNWMNYEGVSKQLDKIFQSDPNKVSIAQMLTQAEYIASNPGLSKTEREAINASKQAQVTSMLQSGSRQFTPYETPETDPNLFSPGEHEGEKRVPAGPGRSALVLPETAEAELSPGEKTSLLLSLDPKSQAVMAPHTAVTAGSFATKEGPYGKLNVVGGVKPEEYTSTDPNSGLFGKSIRLDMNDEDDMAFKEKYGLITTKDAVARGKLKASEKKAAKADKPKTVNMVHPQTGDAKNVTMYSKEHAALQNAGYLEGAKVPAKKEAGGLRRPPGGAKELTEAKALEYYNKAGKDVKKAQEMARKDGYTWKE